MSTTEGLTEEPDLRSARSRRRRVAISQAVVSLVLVTIVVLLPFGLVSVMSDLRHPNVAHHDLTPRNDPDGVHADIHLEVMGLNEWDGTASIRVSAVQSFGRICPWSDRYIFTSVFGDGDDKASSRPRPKVGDLPHDAPDVPAVITRPGR